jgi:hypothetical protein
MIVAEALMIIGLINVFIIAGFICYKFSKLIGKKLK